MQIRVAPILKPAVAIERGALEMNPLVFILQKPDLPPEEQVRAPGAEPRFIQRPPLLMGIVRLQKFELPSEGSDQRMGMVDVGF